MISLLPSAFPGAGPLDLGNPLTDDQLNDDRVAWWLAVPGLAGGSIWGDLAGLSPGDAPVAAPVWGPTSRPGGFMQPTFDGVDASIEGTLSVQIDDWTNVTLACSFRLATTSQKGIAFKVGGGNSTNGIGIGVGTSDADNAGNNLLVLFEARRWITASSAIGTGWFRVLVALVNGAPTIYLNGKQIYNDSAGSPSNPSALFGIGGYASAFRAFAGPIDDCVIWGRALPATEALEEFLDGRAGYRRTLQQLATRALVGSVVGGAPPVTTVGTRGRGGRVGTRTPAFGG